MVFFAAIKDEDVNVQLILDKLKAERVPMATHAAYDAEYWRGFHSGLAVAASIVEKQARRQIAERLEQRSGMVANHVADLEPPGDSPPG